MTLFLQKTFTCPTTNKEISKDLWEYRLGAITAEEYEQRTGKKPDQEESE